MRQLDRSREFGEVWGSENGTRYYQDDLPFDAQGNEIVEKPSKTMTLKKSEKPQLEAA